MLQLTSTNNTTDDDGVGGYYLQQKHGMGLFAKHLPQWIFMGGMRNGVDRSLGHSCATQFGDK